MSTALTTAALPLPALLPLVGGVGLAVGSFLNVVVHRVPAGLSVVSPPSACPECGHRVRERDNVPVLSWVLLRGRCRDCAMPISVRYPAVEAATAVLFVLVALRLTALPLLVACLVLAAAGIAHALIDLEHGRLPFTITGVTAALAGSALGAGWVGVAAVDGAAAAWSAAAPALGGAAVWTAVYGGTWLVTAGRGMGLGDVALAPVVGLVLGAAGWPAGLVGLGAGFVLGAAVGVILLRHGRGVRIPFGPYLLAGAALGLFAGEPLADAYLRLTGLA